MKLFIPAIVVLGLGAYPSMHAGMNPAEVLMLGEPVFPVMGHLGLPIKVAALTNDWGALLDLIDGGALQFRDPHGLTALMEVVWQQRYGLAQLLIESGADVNTATDYGRTALMLAARNGSPALVKLLLESGADVHAQALDGVTAWKENERSQFVDAEDKEEIRQLLRARGALEA